MYLFKKMILLAVNNGRKAVSSERYGSVPLGHYIDYLALFAVLYKLNTAVGLGKKCVVPAHPHVDPGTEPGTSLPDDDIAG